MNTDKQIEETGNYLDGCGKDICKHCNIKRTTEGHDGCIGTLQNVKNACCGHGEDAMAYVQFDNKDYKKNPNKLRLSGNEALKYITENKVNNAL